MARSKCAGRLLGSAAFLDVDSFVVVNANATWPEHDPIGYGEAEKSMCTYGRANFSKQINNLCLCRILTKIFQVLQSVDAVLCL